MALDQWKIRFDNELHCAIEARAAGNEGKARVCARRAAGIAVGEFLDRRNILPPASAIKRLEAMLDFPDQAPELRQIAENLLVVVDQNHNLPSSIDLIVETRKLLPALNLENANSNSTR